MNYIITGLICSGKSTFLEIAQRNNFKILKSDDLVANCYNDKSIINSLKEKLNISTSTSVTKDTIKDLFLKSKENKKIIEDIIHPIIHSIINAELDTNKNSIIEVPAIDNNEKLIKSNKSVFIDTNIENRLKYYKNKHSNEIDFFERINEYQKDYLSIKSYCDIIISNNKNIEQLNKNFDEVIIKS